MQSKQFAYGKNTVAGCKCPAVAAGFEPASGDKSLMPAEMYDEQVSEIGYRNAQSVIDESDAKTAWLEMIDKMERFSYGDEENLKVAKEIAEELGWL